MIQREKKTVFRILIGMGIALLSILMAAFLLFWNELRSLMSLEKMDDYGMYE